MNKTRFLLCIENKDYSASLEPRKLYQQLPDKNAEARGMVRIVDESGEDYLYPASRFIPVYLSQRVMKALAAAG